VVSYVQLARMGWGGVRSYEGDEEDEQDEEDGAE
jgi:hypothetical protein